LIILKFLKCLTTLLTDENNEQQEENFEKKFRRYEDGQMSDLSYDGNVNHNNNLNKDEDEYEEIYFNNRDLHEGKKNVNISKSIKKIKTRSRLKPKKNLISFDEFLTAD